jgi:integrase
VASTISWTLAGVRHLECTPRIATSADELLRKGTFVGSVRKTARGTGWQARYREQSGRQRTRSFRTKGEARIFLGTVETDLAQGTWTDPGQAKVRFSTYTARWRDSLAHLRPGTLNNVDSFLQCHILPAFGAWPIGRIEPADIRTFVANLVDKGLAPTTVAGIYRVVTRIFSTAETDGVIPRTPCRGIKLPRQTTALEPCFLSADEVRRLAEAIEDRYRVLIYAAAYTGMRWGELAGLRVPRLDLLRGTIDVVEALTEVNGTVLTGPTKTGKSRTVSIPRFLGDLLAEHVATFPAGDGHVFRSAQGGPLRRSFYPRHYKPAVSRAGLSPSLRFHDLRHTCAALLIAQGAHPKEIQERLGHSTIQLTFNRYGHLLPTLDGRLRDGLDATWRKAQTAEIQGPAEIVELPR